jgi:MFS-type transporter involved in bile tolerance (Atg22 family)
VAPLCTDSILSTNGFKELKKVWRELRKTKRLKRFLAAFFVFSMGVQTVMLVASHFGSHEIVSGYETKIYVSVYGEPHWLVEDQAQVKKDQPVAEFIDMSARDNLEVEEVKETLYATADGTISIMKEETKDEKGYPVIAKINSSEETPGSVPVKMDAGQLILTILIIQFVAVAGAYLFSFLSGRFGNISTLRFATMIWALICICTYLFVFTTTHFFIIAAFVGLVMGGIQSLSRSTYSKLLPETEDHASYFSFYDICEKMSIVLGLALFGIFNELSPSMREPIIILIGFFVLGYILLWRVKTKSEEEQTN